ncbi:MAG: CVNH domain-containing protein [Alphaproteobacteria bacterium]|nr:CVNH domain-containing protein [Alphaproteobacteria bacterium]
MTMMQQAAARTSERQAFYDQNAGFNNAVLWNWPQGSVIARLTTRRRSFQRYLKSFGLVTMVAVTASLALPMGKAQARGDFSSTCTNLKLNAVDFSKTATLTADCKRQDQKDPKKATHYGASINLNEIITYDQNSRLKWARRPGGGDFQQSCSKDGLGWLAPAPMFPFPGQGSMLYAFCKGNHVGVIDLNDNIANINGDLKYIGWEKVIFDTGSPKTTPPTVQPPLKPGPR